MGNRATLCSLASSSTQRDGDDERDQTTPAQTSNSFRIEKQQCQTARRSKASSCSNQKRSTAPRTTVCAPPWSRRGAWPAEPRKGRTLASLCANPPFWRRTCGLGVCGFHTRILWRNSWNPAAAAIHCALVGSQVSKELPTRTTWHLLVQIRIDGSGFTLGTET